jgi:hypothetical protein
MHGSLLESATRNHTYTRTFHKTHAQHVNRNLLDDDISSPVGCEVERRGSWSSHLLEFPGNMLFTESGMGIHFSPFFVCSSQFPLLPKYPNPSGVGG